MSTLLLNKIQKKGYYEKIYKNYKSDAVELQRAERAVHRKILLILDLVVEAIMKYNRMHREYVRLRDKGLFNGCILEREMMETRKIIDKMLQTIENDAYEDDPGEREWNKYNTGEKEKLL